MSTMIQRVVLSILVLLSVIALAGCSAAAAMRKESPKDIGLLKPGTERARLIAEFGKPEISEMKAGHRYEIYRFRQGQALVYRGGRAVIYTLADIATLGLFEVVSSPVESSIKGTDIAFEVTYDDRDVVSLVRILKDD